MRFVAADLGELRTCRGPVHADLRSQAVRLGGGGERGKKGLEAYFNTKSVYIGLT